MATNTLRTTWVYSLKKDDLTSYLQQFALTATGTVEEMRKRFAKFVSSEHEEEEVKRLLELQSICEANTPISPGVRLTLPTTENGSLSPIKTETATKATYAPQPLKEDRVIVIDIVRKWGLKYDGGKDTLGFVERVEELASMYDIKLEAVLPVMSEFFRDKALIWFRNNNKSWKQWTTFKKDFCDFFMPPRYFEKLEDEIRKRVQRPRESFKDYVLALQDLMRHANLSQEQKLERIFRNSQSDYQWYIRRRDFSTLDELIQLAADLESIPTSTNASRGEHHRQLSDKSNEGGANTSQNSFISTMRSINSQTYLSWEEGKLKAHVLIEGKVISSIIDTGATRSFITPEVVEQLFKQPRYVPVEIDVLLADGSTRIISKAIRCRVVLGKDVAEQEFLVMNEATENVILGLDFLRTYKATFTCAGLTVKSYRENSAELRSIQVSENVIPKNQQATPTSENSNNGLPVEIVSFLDDELSKFGSLTGLSTAATHRIVMKDEHTIKLRYAPRNPAMQAVIDEEVNKLLKCGYIEPSHSPYSFPITLVRKKNGTWRMCMDFRQLNARSIPDAYPLPKISTILDRLRDAKFISSLDLKDGYWQIPMEEESKKYTAFAVTGRGLYQWKVMPFGLHSAPATFQRALDNVIGADMEPYAFAYLDDIIVIGRTVEEHLNNLKEVFRRLRAANLKINIDKCEFFRSETKYLGHVVTKDGIKTDPDKVAAIAEMSSPRNVKEVRRFLGVTSWYRRFVPNFAEISQPLTTLLKKGKHWKWQKEQQEAFEALKSSLTNAPVLSCPDFGKPFVLQTDASDFGLGVVLTQEIEGSEHEVAYASRHLNGAEKNYSATEKECLAIVLGIQKMRH